MPYELIEYEELRKINGSLHIPYKTLLSTHEWSNKRNYIISKDGCCCTECGKGATVSHWDVNTRKTFHFWFGEEVPQFLADERGISEELFIPSTHHHPKPINLQVHHKLYIIGRLPWDYDDKYLITLCNECHTAFHAKYTVSVYGHIEKQIRIDSCNRCAGAGFIPQYAHVQNGVCFKCNGYGYDEYKFDSNRE